MNTLVSFCAKVALFDGDVFVSEVLLLKQNLKAPKISSLHAALGRIETVVKRQIRDMELSLTEADSVSHIDVGIDYFLSARSCVSSTRRINSARSPWGSSLRAFWAVFMTQSRVAFPLNDESLRIIPQAATAVENR